MPENVMIGLVVLILYSLETSTSIPQLEHDPYMYQSLPENPDSLKQKKKLDMGTLLGSK
jgi:hypothetical protein